MIKKDTIIVHCGNDRSGCSWYRQRFIAMLLMTIRAGEINVVISPFEGGDKDDIIALLVFQCADFDDLIDKDEYDALGVEHNDEDMYCAGIEDISDHARPCDFLDAVKGSVEHILDNTYDIDILKKMYSIITFADPEDAKPTEKQVQAEIKRRKKANEKDGDPKKDEPVDDEVEDVLSRKNSESEHDEEKEGEDE